MKKIVTLAAVLLASSALAACAKSDNADEAAQPDNVEMPAEQAMASADADAMPASDAAALPGADASDSPAPDAGASTAAAPVAAPAKPATKASEKSQ